MKAVKSQNATRHWKGFCYRRPMKLFAQTLTLSLTVLSLSCATTTTGRKQLKLLPDRQMDSLGQQSFEEMKAKVPSERSGANVNYVRCVADSITRLPEVQSQTKDWEVVVFKDETANAFALPGGKIGVHTGMLKVAKNQDQLAAVLGHEVGHVLAKHGNERVSQQLLESGAMLAISKGIGEDNPQSGLILGAIGLGTQLAVLLPFSRQHESESDAIGLDLMAKAGFDPQQSVQLWKNMAAAGGGKPPEFLSTHPSDSTRIQGLESKMGQALAQSAKARASGKRPRCQQP